MLRLRRFSYRFAEQGLNSKLTLTPEIEVTLTDSGIDASKGIQAEFQKFLTALAAVGLPAALFPIYK